MIKFIVIKRLRMLHGDRGGQSIIFVALVLFTLVAFMALVINVGHRTEQKVEIQVGTDAAALSGGTWIARGLNTIAILNVSMTQTLAWIIFLKAFKRTHTAAVITVAANQAAAAALCIVPFTAPVGCPWSSLLVYVNTYINTIMGPIAKKIPTPMVDNLWRFMRSLHKAEKAVKFSTGTMANLSAANVARQNISNLGALPALILPALSRLPAEPGTFKDICDRTNDGGPGYENFFDNIAPIDMRFPQGSFMRVKDWFALLWAPASPMIPPPLAMYYLFVELANNSLCSGRGKKSGQVKQFTLSCSDCDTKGFKMVKKKRVSVPGESKWYGAVFEVTALNGDTEKNNPGLEDGNITTIITKRYKADGSFSHNDSRDINGRDFGEASLTGTSPSLEGLGTVDEDAALYPHGWCMPGSYSSPSGDCPTYDVPDTTTNPNGITTRTTNVRFSISDPEQKNPYDKTTRPVTMCNVTQKYEAIRDYYVYTGYTDVPIKWDKDKNPIEWRRDYNWSYNAESRFYKEEWEMTKCVYEETKNSIPDKTKNKPKPFVLVADWESKTNYLALVFKDVEDELTLGSTAAGGNAKTNVAMAQVKVSNSTGEDDLFNQDWHARLAPVNMNQVSLSIGGITLTIPRKLKKVIADLTGELVVH